MTGLKPLGEEAPPEALALARALRDLFAGLAPLSVRRYAVRRSYDSGAVSRYFGGRRVPHWDFVRNLLGDVAEARGTEVPTEETVAMFKALHRAAVYASRGPVHRVRLLELQLAEADGEAQRAARSVRRLEETLDDRERRVRELRLQLRELRAEGDGGPGEYARLREEVRELREELERVRELHRRAEERCERLEHRLAEAEAAPPAVTPVVPPVVPPAVPAARPESPGREGAGGEGPGRAEPGRGGPGREDPDPYGLRIEGGGNTVHFYGAPPPMDEEAAAALSAQISYGTSEASGLLVDGRTVVSALEWDVATKARRLVRSVDVGGLTVPAEVREVSGVDGLAHKDVQLLVLELREPVPPPAVPVRLDRKPPIGSRLLASARNPYRPYSCLVDLRGRTGGLLRVVGEMDGALRGAPMFSERGGLVGFQISTYRNGTLGYLLPAAALDALTTVSLPG
ncbi:hypothetical protein ACIQRS_08550 [Streptomyces termitum]|uniref:Uncharacterized protein n=1 Tax=Streptomyces termitum TaxID=67368 RepID=A0A918W3R9_9ACTN|nr:hypothetical protein [Streptomyces termitum]GHA64437.1 hypothetical protein GCM10010305_02480 [Streptomyces termitum]